MALRTPIEYVLIHRTTQDFQSIYIRFKVLSVHNAFVRYNNITYFFFQNVIGLYPSDFTNYSSQSNLTVATDGSRHRFIQQHLAQLCFVFYLKVYNNKFNLKIIHGMGKIPDNFIQTY